MSFLRLNIPIFNPVGEWNNEKGLILSSVLCPVSHSAPWNNLVEEKSAMLNGWKKIGICSTSPPLPSPHQQYSTDFKRNQLENGEQWTQRPFLEWNPVVRYWPGQSLNDLVAIQVCFQWGIKFMFWRRYPWLFYPVIQIFLNNLQHLYTQETLKEKDAGLQSFFLPFANE